jgi:hypothetical protein
MYSGTAALLKRFLKLKSLYLVLIFARHHANINPIHTSIKTIHSIRDAINEKLNSRQVAGINFDDMKMLIKQGQ